jgi:hypothetical protein
VRAGHSATRLDHRPINMEPLRGSRTFDLRPINMAPLWGVRPRLDLRVYKHGTATGFAHVRPATYKHGPLWGVRPRLDLRALNMEPLRGSPTSRPANYKHGTPTGFETNYEKSPNGPRRLVGNGIPASS